jgi:hypothetical protein
MLLSEMGPMTMLDPNNSGSSFLTTGIWTKLQGETEIYFKIRYFLNISS